MELIDKSIVKKSIEDSNMRSVLMLSTAPETRGGIAAVVKTYKVGGLFKKVALNHLATHCDGSKREKAGAYLRAVWDTLSLLRRKKVSLVHAHVSSGASFWRKSVLLLLARKAGVPTIFHLHSGGFADWVGGTSTSSPAVGRFRTWWVRHTFENSSVVIVLTDSWSKWVLKFAPTAKVEVLSNPVELPSSPLVETDRGSRHGQGRVLFLGWIYDFKGCFDLLQAWVLFSQRCPGWRLVVGGKGEVDLFLAEAKRLGVDKDLEFLGWVTGAEKDRELRRADIFVLPSYREGMPVSVLEAMAYGAAVITTPVGGVPDMMKPGVHGLWVQPGDIAGLSNCLAELATSPTRRLELADAARVHVERDSSVDAVVRRLVEIYALATSDKPH